MKLWVKTMEFKRNPYDLQINMTIYLVSELEPKNIVAGTIIKAQKDNKVLILTVHLHYYLHQFAMLNIEVQPNGSYKVLPDAGISLSYIDDLPDDFNDLHSARLFYVKSLLRERAPKEHSEKRFMVTAPIDLKKHDYFYARDDFGEVRLMCKVSSMQRKAGYLEAQVINGSYTTRFDLTTLRNLAGMTICHTNKVDLLHCSGREDYANAIVDVRHLHRSARTANEAVDFFVAHLQYYLRTVGKSNFAQVFRKRPALIIVVGKNNSHGMFQRAVTGNIKIVYTNNLTAELFKLGKVVGIVTDTRLPKSLETRMYASFQTTNTCPTLFHTVGE